MNILFVLYGDFTSSSANPLALYARELRSRGHECAIAVPSNLESVTVYENPAFIPILYDAVLSSPDRVFSDSRPADIIHACTPREAVRRFVTAYMALRPTPLIVYLEDNEFWISIRALGFDEETLFEHTEQMISERLPNSLSHPFRYDTFIGLADAAVVIQDKLRITVPPWVHCETVMIGVDLDLFSPRPSDPLFRKQYNLAEDEKVIVYHGGLNAFNKSALENLCRAVGLINERGYLCRLLRTGPFALNFLGTLPARTASAINDLGLLPKRELPKLLALADVFVQPGEIDPFEDFRLAGKVPEFLAMGRPVILPNVNIAHLFTDGSDAFLLRSGSPDEIATKCIELFNDPQLANRIGQAGHRLAVKYFDVRRQTRRLEDVYKAASNIFNREIAAETWRDADANTPVTLLLARKLRLLACSTTKLEFPADDVLREHAKYLELASRRVIGLETLIAERNVADKNAKIKSLTDQITQRDRQITELNKAIEGFLNSQSWRITLPFRVAKSFLGKARQRMNSFRPVGRL